MGRQGPPRIRALPSEQPFPVAFHLTRASSSPLLAPHSLFTLVHNSKMQPSTSIMALAGLASMASALASRDFVFPVTVPIAKRQAPGSPQYACHEDCGMPSSLMTQ